MPQLIRDAAELEELSSWKSDKILPPRVLLAYKWSGLNVYCQVYGPVSASERAGVGMCGPCKQSASLDTVVYCKCVVCVALDN